ncbi:MAG: PDR/VanB family oxidoreductase [Paracoccaceae bacterium]|nr:PDR/VanB family oxidoreductase [Paracoccaceae bacterium]
MSAGAEKIAVTVSEKVVLNDLVTRFQFKRTDGGSCPAFSGGAQTVIEMKDGDMTRLNPYSLMSNPLTPEFYEVSIRRDSEGRGGSMFMHDQVNVGDEMVLSYPVNLFSLDLRARKQLLIAGGIGITPFIAQIKQMSLMSGNFELHYSVRTKSLGSYVDDLTDQHPNNVHIYYDDQDQQIELEHLLSGQPLGTHVYVCGPKGMINWVRSTAESLGWPESSIHFEEFLAPQSGKPFSATLAKSNVTVDVGEHESLLEAIERAGVDAPYLCRGGACGQCETRVIEHDGDIKHHDHWLEDEERACGDKIMPCVSRFEGKTLVLDR